MVPELMLLGFSAWTLTLLVFTVGLYRWRKILGGAGVGSFSAVEPTGAPWYLRSVRAHANCVENLPVFVAVVFLIRVFHISGVEVDTLCEVVLAARICQSLVHVTLVQTDRVVAVRFSLFLLQVICMFTLMTIVFTRWP